jgi:hypothetical protein
MAKDLVVIVTPPGGTITQLGSDLARGVWVEGASWEHSLADHGALRAQFTLRRRAEQEWPDLQPFTPVVIMKSGSVAWTGRIQETPTIRGMENLITVQCEGWPMHLKDDVLQKVFVHNDLTAWADARTKGVSLASWRPVGYEVDVGSGNIRIAVATVAGADVLGGVVIDAGPYSTIKSAIVTYVGGGVANLDLRIAGTDGSVAGALADVANLDPTPIATVATTVVNVFPTAHRFVHIYARSVAAIPAGDTAWVSISNIILFADDTAYRAGSVSVLKASQIIAAVLPYAPKISQSTAGISTTSFGIPHFVGPATAPADYIDAANAYHLYQWFLEDDAAGGPPSLVFQPIPTSPTLVANVGAGIVYEDASRNDGGDIYNRVIVDSTDAAGNNALEERMTATLPAAIADPDVAFDTPSTVQPSANAASFDTDTSGWLTSTGTLVRDTGVFDTAPASGRWGTDVSGIMRSDIVSIPGLTVGKTYQFTYRIRAAATWTTGSAQATITDAASVATYAQDVFTNSIGVAFITKTLTFKAAVSTIRFFVSNVAGLNVSTNILYLDSIRIMESRPTIVDRQGFQRTRVLTTSSRLTAAAADQIGDVFLQAHRFTPLRGTLTVQGAALRTVQGDVPIPAPLVARYLGAAVLINETDFDLGGIGRVGNIANVAYDEASDTATVAIDTRKDFVDALLARLAVFTGGS